MLVGTTIHDYLCHYETRTPRKTGPEDIRASTNKLHRISQVDGVGSGSMVNVCFANETKVTTTRSTMLTPGEKISRNARLDRLTMPSFAWR